MRVWNEHLSKRLRKLQLRACACRFLSSSFGVLKLAAVCPGPLSIFSRAGNLSDPNMDPEFLVHLVMAAANKKAFKPMLQAIKDKYFELFRGKGGIGDKHFAGEGEAGPSEV